MGPLASDRRFSGRTPPDDNQFAVGSNIDGSRQREQTASLHRGGVDRAHGLLKTVPMASGHVTERPALLRPDRVQPFPNDGAGYRSQASRIDDDAARTLCPQREPIDLFDGKASDLGLILRQPRQTSEGAIHRRIETTSQKRQQPMPDSIAGIAKIVVRAILPERLPDGREVRSQLGPRDFEQRSDEDRRRQRPRTGNAPQTADARSPKNSVEYGFNLVIGCVGGGDVTRPEFTGEFCQQLITRPASRGLQADGGGHFAYRPRRMNQPAWKLKLLGQVDDEFGVGIGFFTSESVVDVHGDQAARSGPA